MTFPAEHVVGGFADELDSLGFDGMLEKFAFLGFGKKPPAPAPVPTGGFGKLWHGIKTSKGGMLAGGIGKKVFGLPGAVVFGAVTGAGLLGKKQLRQKQMKNMGRA